jgi:hypothetical protein
MEYAFLHVTNHVNKIPGNNEQVARLIGWNSRSTTKRLRRLHVTIYGYVSSELLRTTIVFLRFIVVHFEIHIILRTKYE